MDNQKGKVIEGLETLKQYVIEAKTEDEEYFVKAIDEAIKVIEKAMVNNKYYMVRYVDEGVFFEEDKEERSIYSTFEKAVESIEKWSNEINKDDGSEWRWFEDECGCKKTIELVSVGNGEAMDERCFAEIILMCYDDSE